MDINYSIGTYYTEATDMHRFIATENGEQIGGLWIDLDRTIIMNIEVIKSRRGEGIATALYNEAVKTLPAVLHAPEAARTFEGNRFAEAVGGETAEHMDELEAA